MLKAPKEAVPILITYFYWNLCLTGMWLGGVPRTYTKTTCVHKKLDHMLKI